MIRVLLTFPELAGHMFSLLTVVVGLLVVGVEVILAGVVVVLVAAVLTEEGHSVSRVSVNLKVL